MGWLACILVLALAGAGGWTLMQGMEREKNLKRRISQLEKLAEAEDKGIETELRQLEQGLQRELQSGLQALRGDSERQAEEMQRILEQVTAQSEQLASFSANDHEIDFVLCSPLINLLVSNAYLFRCLTDGDKGAFVTAGLDSASALSTPQPTNPTVPSAAADLSKRRRCQKTGSGVISEGAMRAPKGRFISRCSVD